jgi:hypothetical protein
LKSLGALKRQRRSCKPSKKFWGKGIDTRSIPSSFDPRLPTATGGLLLPNIKKILQRLVPKESDRGIISVVSKGGPVLKQCTAGRATPMGCASLFIS